MSIDFLKKILDFSTWTAQVKAAIISPLFTWIFNKIKPSKDNPTNTTTIINNYHFHGTVNVFTQNNKKTTKIKSKK
jgi:hypothetical protein